MVEQQRQRLEHEITNLVDDLDKSYLRNFQKEMHLCAVQCCDNSELSMQGVQNCVEKCSRKLMKANNHVQQELSNFQNRVQRCVMDCNDEIRDRMGPTNNNEADMEKFGRMFEKCATNCCDKHVNSLSNLSRNIKSFLANISTVNSVQD